MILYKAGFEYAMWESGCLCQRIDDNLRAESSVCILNGGHSVFKVFKRCNSSPLPRLKIFVY